MNDKEYKLVDRLFLRLKQYAFSAKQDVRVKALEELNGEKGKPGLFSQWESLKRKRRDTKPKKPETNPVRDNSGRFVKQESKTAMMPGPLMGPKGALEGLEEIAEIEKAKKPLTTKEIHDLEEFILEFAFESVNSKNPSITPLPVKTDRVPIGSTANISPVTPIPEPTEEMKKHKLKVNQIRYRIFKRVG